MSEPQTTDAAQASHVKDRVDRPHVGWWISILFGMGFLTLLVVHADSYQLFSETITPIFSHSLLSAILAVAVGLHLFEGFYAYRLAGQLGLVKTRNGWLAQTLALGFPSLRLLLARRPPPAR